MNDKTETTAIEKAKPRAAATTHKRALQDQWKQMQAILPPNLDAGRFIAVAMLAIQRNEKLRDCSPTSFALAVMQSAALGLEVGTESYLVPYGKQVQCQPGYQCLAKLALQSGNVTDIWMDVIREGDDFEIVRGTNPDIRHTRRAPLGAEILHAYCCSRSTSGHVSFTVLDKDQLEKRRAKSMAKNSGPWSEWYEEMCMAKAVKAHAKLLPKSAMMNAAVALHDATEMGRTIPITALVGGGDND